jgi:preprotein translocase subunit YajC
MNVVGSMGGIIGTIRQVRADDFLVERSLARDVYVPFDAVRAVVEDLVELDVPSDQVDGMHWASP